MELVQTAPAVRTENEFVSPSVMVHPQAGEVSAWMWEEPHSKALAALCYASTLRRIPQIVARYFHALECCFRKGD
jgi:hypothetical protein